MEPKRLHQSKLDPLQLEDSSDSVWGESSNCSFTRHKAEIGINGDDDCTRESFSHSRKEFAWSMLNCLVEIAKKKDKEIVDFIKRVLELPSSQETSTNA
ncbi:hypothetical protein BLOT_000762 [Blomia tropicalis]|nr:hypothetical protein BLOT_000762 [Blomia tropicalis]